MGPQVRDLVQGQSRVQPGRHAAGPGSVCVALVPVVPPLGSDHHRVPGRRSCWAVVPPGGAVRPAPAAAVGVRPSLGRCPPGPLAHHPVVIVYLSVSICISIYLSIYLYNTLWCVPRICAPWVCSPSSAAVHAATNCFISVPFRRDY